MANSAVVGALKVLLTADTAEFKRAIAGVDAETKKFANTLARDLEPSQKRVNAAMRDFLGTREIGHAEAYARAVQQIGGATRLTETDQRKVNAAMKEAIAHYTALGRQAPTHIKALEAATRGVATSTNDLIGKAKGLLGAFGIGVGVSSIVMFGKQVFDTADEIDDLSNKMGVGAEAAQRFKWAAQQAGAELGDVSSSVLKLNQNLAQGDDSTVEALSSIGLEFRSIRAMKPEDAFRAVADAIGKISDPMEQTRVAMQLFGKSGADVLTMIRTGALQASDSVSVLTDETVKALADAKDEWQKFFNWLIVQSGNAIGKIAGSADEFAVIWGAITGRGPQALAEYKRQRLLSEMGSNVGPDALGILESFGLASGPAKKPGAGGAGGAGGGLSDHMKALSDLAFSWSREKIQERIKETSDALVVFQTKGLKMTSDQMQKLIEDTYDWLEAGYQVPKPLYDLFAANQVLIPSLNRLRVASRDAMNELVLRGDGYQLANRPEFAITGSMMQQGWGSRFYLSREFGSYFDQQKEQKADLADYADLVGIITANLQQMGQAGGEAWGGISRLLANGVQMTFNLRTALQAAGTDAEKSSAAWSAFGMQAVSMFASWGIGQITSLMAQQKAQDLQAKRDLYTLRQLGFANTDRGWAEFINSADYRQSVIQHPEMLEQQPGENALTAYLRHVQERLTGVAQQFGALQTKLQQFGGVAPAAVRPFIEQLLTAQNIPADIRAQLEGLMAKPSWQSIQDLADSRGIERSALGAGFNQQRVGDIGLSYVRELEMLKDIGADMTGVLTGMADELSAIVMDALKNGSALPATLKPFLEQLDQMGKLIDDNGNRIDVASLAFRDIEDETLKGIKAVLEQIRDLLAGLPTVAQRAGQALQSMIPPDGIRAPTMPVIGAGHSGGYIDGGPGTPIFGDLAGLELAGAGDQTIIVPLHLDGRVVTQAVVRVAKNHGTTRI